MPEGVCLSQIAVLYFFVLFFVGVIFLIQDVKNSKQKVYHVPASKEGWIDFSLLIWCLLMIIFLMQHLWSAVHLSLPAHWNKVLVGFSIQLATVLFIILSAQYYPSLFGFPVNSKKISLTHSIREGITAFLAAVPLVYLTAFVWNITTKIWHHFGIDIPLQRQELVELFTQSGSTLLVSAIIIFSTVIAPLTEEFIFRAGIYRFLKSKMSPLFAISLSALVFAWVHYNILSFLPLFLLGLLLARSYEKTGHIITPIIFHSLFNANTLIFLLLCPDLNLIGS